MILFIYGSFKWQDDWQLIEKDMEGTGCGLI
jgi:hypothetical protein